MEKNILLVVLTNNHLLYAGLVALFPEHTVRLVKYDDQEISFNINLDEKLIIIVDDLIMFCGKWSGFNMLLKIQPDAPVVWLAQAQVGWIFPGKNGYILPKSSCKNVILESIMSISEGEGAGDPTIPVKLTTTEKLLLPYFMLQTDINIISKVTGNNDKSLYSYRERILRKTGFNRLHFLQLIYKVNGCLPGVDI